jgi:MFS family permease
MPAKASPISISPAERRSAMTKVSVAWLFGAIWTTGIAGAPFARYATALGCTDWHFGLLAAMPFLAALLSLPASLWIDASGARKPIFLIALLSQRFMWFAIALLPWYLRREPSPFNHHLALFVFMAMMAFTHICQAIGGPAWVSWMADLVPEPIRGRYFAKRRQLGIVSAIPTALLAGVLLDRLAPVGDDAAALRWCAILFAIVTLGGVVDIAMFAKVPPVTHRTKNAGPIWLTLLRPLRDRHFRWFCLYMAVLTAAIAPMGQFTTLYLVEKLRINATDVQMMLLVGPLIGQFVIVPVWGRVADRFGRRPMMAIATLGLVPIGLGWCAVGAGHAWLGHVLSIGGAMLWAGVETANFNLVIEMSGTRGDDESEAAGGRGSGYVSVNSVILSIAGALGGLGAGWMMTSLRGTSHVIAGVGTIGPYEMLFIASAALRLFAGVVFLPRLHEPGAKPTREAIEYMADNIYSNVLGVMLDPIKRFVRRR